MAHEAEVFETESGLAVVSTDTESVRVGLRQTRRGKNRLRRQRRSQRRSGGGKGTAAWMGKAKTEHKRKRHEQ